jgi:hypothetical protein
MRPPPAEGNFCNQHGNALKLTIVQDCNRHIGYVDKIDHMAYTYSISRWVWKYMKKLFFHFLFLKILKSFIIFSYGEKLTHRDCKLFLVKDLMKEGASDGTQGKT